MKKLLWMIVLVTVGAVAHGCVGTGSSAAAVVLPEWIQRGSGAADGDEHVFYAVGAKSGIKNPALLRAAADNLARAEMQIVFERFVAVLMRDYAAREGSPGTFVTSEEQLVEQAIKTLAGGILSRLQIAKHWIHPVDGTMYALARLDLAAFLAQLDKSKALSARIKTRARRSAERAFAELSVRDDALVRNETSRRTTTRPPSPDVRNETPRRTPVVAQPEGGGRRRVQAPARKLMPIPRKRRRFALLVANYDYIGSEPDLRNPPKDVRLLARALSSVGFKTQVKANLTKAELHSVLRAFTRRVEPDSDLFFYYAGHGVALRARRTEPYRNYLLGVGFRAGGEIEAISGDVVAVDDIVEYLERSTAATRIIVFDACRDQPFTRQWFRGGAAQRGFVRVGAQDAGDGTLIAFSAKGGQRALDAVLGLAVGPYAHALAAHLIVPGKDILHVFSDVGRDVRKVTGGAQTPEYRDVLGRRYSFVPGP